MPDVCCCNGCKNRRVTGVNIPFYRVPKGKTPIEVRRRKDWLKVLFINREEMSTWSEDRLSRAFVCGAHFIFGKLWI